MMTSLAAKRSLFAFGYNKQACGFCNHPRRLLRGNRLGIEVGAMTSSASSAPMNISQIKSPHRIPPGLISHDLVSNEKNADRRKWNLVGAICLERPPVISAEESRFERSFHDLLKRQEFEQSLYSDHEVNKFEDVKKAKQGNDPNLTQEEEVVLQTAQDREDAWNEGADKFTPASRKHGFEDDLKSLQRKLDQKLYLVVDQLLGKRPQWIFPQTTWRGPESLRKTAERALQLTCGDDLQITTLAGTPVGWYKYKYPVESELGSRFYGAKVFFFKAIIRKGSVLPSSEVVDYKWVTREELKKVVKELYFDRVERFTFESGKLQPGDDPDHLSLMKLRY